MRKIFLSVFLIALCSVAFGQKYYTLNEIPNPKVNGQDYYVSNPDGILSYTDSLNRLLTKLDKQTKIELAIVAVKDFDQNQEDFDFAKDLFEKWGIGKTGANNGLLLFIATERKKYRFISGYGVEGMLPDLILKRIGEHHLVPAFKENRYDDGVLDAANDIFNQLTNPKNQAEIQSLLKEVKSKEATSDYSISFSIILVLLTIGSFWLVKKQLPKLDAKKKDGVNSYDKFAAGGCIFLFFALITLVFISIFAFGFEVLNDVNSTGVVIILYILIALVVFFMHLGALGILRKFYSDDENFFQEAKKFNIKNSWLALLSPFIIITLIVQGLKRRNTSERFTPPKDRQGKNMVRVNRDINVDGAPFLTKAQQAEEKAKVYDYDIWQSTDQVEHLIKSWPAETFNDFTECPKCGVKTFSNPKQKTEKRATYTSTGTAREVKECSFCKYEELIRVVTLAMLVKSSSSGSSSSGGSSSSSSTSSGSFGGGSSGGGGAGGSW